MLRKIPNPRKRHRIFVVTVLSVLAAWSAASVVMLPRPAVAQATALADANVQSAVRRLLDEDPLLDATTLGVHVEQGVATLQGLARDLRDRDRAQRLATRVRGVRAIINSIEVTPPDIGDDEVAQEVRDALKSEPVTEDIELSVRVQGGEVFIGGRVGSLVERKAIYVVASGVRGVLAVDISGIAVAPQVARPAEELQHEIEARWAWNVWTTQADLSVVVDDGVARIDGVVPSLWVRDLAAALASVAGVKRVDASRVGLLPAGTDLMVRDRPRAFSDREIAEAIDRALFFDVEIFSSNIDVRMHEGQVTLAGTVPTLAQREKAAIIAADTVGVSVVRNDLVIRVPDAPSDERLVDLVKERLARSPALIDAPRFGVTAQAGIVTLFGTVDDLYDRRRAEALVKRQYGVTGVVNTLHVSGNATSTDR